MSAVTARDISPWWRPCAGRLSHVAELAGQAAGAAEHHSRRAGRVHQPGRDRRPGLRSPGTQRTPAGARSAETGGRRPADRPGQAASAPSPAWSRRAASSPKARTKAASDMLSRARQGWSPPRWLEHRLMLIQSRVCAAAGDVKSAVEVAERAEPQAALDAAVALAQAWLAAGDPQAAGRALAAGVASPGEPPEQVRLEGWLVDARLSYGAATGRGAADHSSGRCGWVNPSGSGSPSPWSAPGSTRCCGAIPSLPTPTRTCWSPDR